MRTLLYAGVQCWRQQIKLLGMQMTNISEIALDTKNSSPEATLNLSGIDTKTFPEKDANLVQVCSFSGHDTPVCLCLPGTLPLPSTGH